MNCQDPERAFARLHAHLKEGACRPQPVRLSPAGAFGVPSPNVRGVWCGSLSVLAVLGCRSLIRAPYRARAMRRPRILIRSNGACNLGAPCGAGRMYRPAVFQTRILDRRAVARILEGSGPDPGGKSPCLRMLGWPGLCLVDVPGLAHGLAIGLAGGMGWACWAGERAGWIDIALRTRALLYYFAQDLH